MSRLPEDAEEAEAIVKDILFSGFLREAGITREAFAALSPVARGAVVEALIPLAMAPTSLTGRERKSIVNSDMQLTKEHRLALSAGRPGASSAFLKAIRKAGYTLNSLAKKLGVSPSLLSMHRRAKADPNARPIPEARAREIEALTGWPADAAHWPAGLT